MVGKSSAWSQAFFGQSKYIKFIDRICWQRTFKIAVTIVAQVASHESCSRCKDTYFPIIFWIYQIFLVNYELYDFIHHGTWV